MDPDRGPRRHGRRPAAGRHHGRGLDASPSNASPDSHRLPHSARVTSTTQRQDTIDEALEIDRPLPPRQASRSQRRVFSAMLPRLLPEIVKPRHPARHALTDQTSAHDPVNGYLPEGLDPGRMARRSASPIRRPWKRPRPCASMKRPCSRPWSPISIMQGVPTLDYGNNIRQMALDDGTSRTPSSSRASCQPISGRSSAAA